MVNDLLDDLVMPAPASTDFEEFVAATSTRMLRTAVLLTGDRHAAEDLVQSAYAQAFVRWRLVSRADHPAAYTRTILTRKFLAERQRKRVVEVPLLTETDRLATVTDPALRLSLLQVLDTLPALDRAVLVLRYFHDSAGRRGRCTGRPVGDRMSDPSLPCTRSTAHPLPRPGRQGLRPTRTNPCCCTK